MATLTALAGQSGAQPKGHHVGLQVVHGERSLGVVSAGDQIIMAKVPNKSRIIAIQRNFAGGAGNDFVAQIGYDASLSAFGSTTGLGGVAFLTKGLPYLVSLSDDAVEQFIRIKVSVPSMTSATATGALSLQVLFTRDLT
jgi:hypothetical protein